MRILLIATNRHRRLMSLMDARPAPIGLAYIAGYLDPDRHSIEVLDLMFSEDYLADTEARVREFQPELIGISLRNLDNSSYMDPQWALPTTKEVIDKVRSITDSPIVCGGPAFSLLPRECFNFLGPDLGIAGDGGETFAQLADCIESGETYHNLPGLVYRDTDCTLVCKGPAYSNFSKPPRFDELDMGQYEQAGFGIGIVTKLDDTFSHSMRVGQESTQWRVLKPVEDVVHEVREMKDRFGLRKVFFIDSGFNVPLPHAKALCNSLIEANLNVHWNSYLAPVPEACDEEVLSLMKQAGSALVIMKGLGGPGLEEEGLEPALQTLGDVCGRCDRAGIHYTISQYFGEPGETRETVETKLDFLRGINPAIANLRVGTRIRPETPTAQAALQEGLITDESELIRPIFYVAEPVRDWIVDRLKVEAAANPRWNLF
ncbi:MAG: radical SAM protein [Stenotrophomonas maltophilia]